MSNSNTNIRKIRTAANIGLYGSIFLCIATIVEHYLDKYIWLREITTDEYTRHLFVSAGLIIAVADIAYILFAMRKRVPQIRQMEGVEPKLIAYRSLVSSVFYPALLVVLLVAAFIVTTHENTMIMLLLLLVISLMLNYPNMYKMKADMGLNDDEMIELFGNEYHK